MVGEKRLELLHIAVLDPKSSAPFSPSQNPSYSLSFAAAWRVLRDARHLWISTKGIDHQSTPILP